MSTLEELDALDQSQQGGSSNNEGLDGIEQEILAAGIDELNSRTRLLENDIKVSHSMNL